jgi:N6-L-threonylcarbamoyladenine synthase
MKILAIETSCDDTGIALIESNKAGNIKILANLVSSQIETHRPFGGVVPNLAKREHEKALPILFDELTKNYKLKAESCDLIAVTKGPGLAPCLWTGVNFAKDLAQKIKKPLIGINHLKGHIFVNTIENKLAYPVLALIVSGGHTQLVFSKKLGHYKIIGETKDDAAGEAFDKVAKLIGLGYPGGPEISKRAESGNPKRFDFPRPMINSKDFDFSFSGLKTAVLYLVKGLYSHSDKKPLKLTDKNIADLCASFQQAVVDVLVSKTLLAARVLKPKALILGGGVAANKHLRETIKAKIEKELPSVTCLLSPISMTGDNALMIAMAAVAEYKQIKPGKDPVDLKAEPNLRLDS